MPYYISEYIGAGTTLDPFRPRGSDQPGWSAIDLRPDGGATLDGGGLNACLLHLPLADADPRLVLAALDAQDTLGTQLRRAIGTRLKIADPTKTTWDDVVAELMLLPPVNGWKRIIETQAHRLEIWLGGLLWSQRVIAGGTTITESFNTADSTTLGPDLTWTEVSGDSDILTNTVRIVTLGGAYGASARAETDLASADHYAQLDVTSLGGASNAYGPCVRFAAAADTFYQTELRSNGDLVMRKNVSASFTDILTSGNTLSLPDTAKIDVSGSTLRHYFNGTQQGADQTDTAITSNLRCGIRGYQNDTPPRADNFEAADLAAAAASGRLIGGKLTRSSGLLVGGGLVR